MKALPVFIAVVIVVALIRLGLRRGRSPSPRMGVVTRLRDRALLGETGLVAGREIRERIRGRVFRVVTVILFGVVTAAVVIPTLHAATTMSRRVGVVASSASLDAELQDLAKNVRLSAELVKESNLAQARAALSVGNLDMVVDGTRKILVKDPISASDTSAEARYVRAVSVTLGAQHAFTQAGLTPQQAATVAGARPLPVESLQPGKQPRTTAAATALLGVILIFIVLTQYLTWTLMGVMEEKASRVVEVLLATMRPIQLLAGKVIGIGVVALAQAVALVAFALVLAKVVGSSLVHGAAPLVVAATFVWLVLGYAFYSWMYAAAGSLAERQDQVQSLALPLSAPLILGYIVSLLGVSSGKPSLLVKVLAYLPPTAPFAMPTLIGFGEATWWQFLLSTVLTLVCTLVVAILAARVYRTAVLQTGRRVQLRELIPTRTRRLIDTRSGRSG
jgi:ABC-2 type transport system permease protein